VASFLVTLRNGGGVGLGYFGLGWVWMGKVRIDRIRSGSLVGKGILKGICSVVLN
jgi:hypothetical protein